MVPMLSQVSPADGRRCPLGPCPAAERGRLPWALADGAMWWAIAGLVSWLSHL